MDERRHRLDPRGLLGALAVALVAAALWAASAFAAGDSSSSERSETGSPAAAYVQSRDEAPDRDDCPEREGGSSQSSST